jgi:hypothetical protein
MMPHIMLVAHLRTLSSKLDTHAFLRTHENSGGEYTRTITGQFTFDAVYDYFPFTISSTATYSKTVFQTESTKYVCTSEGRDVRAFFESTNTPIRWATMSCTEPIMQFNSREAVDTRLTFMTLLNPQVGAGPTIAGNFRYEGDSEYLPFTISSTGTYSTTIFKATGANYVCTSESRAVEKFFNEADTPIQNAVLSCTPNQPVMHFTTRGMSLTFMDWSQYT